MSVINRIRKRIVSFASRLPAFLKILAGNKANAFPSGKEAKHNAPPPDEALSEYAIV